MSNRDELRQAVARAILEAQLWPGAYAKAPEAERNHAFAEADAAIAAYEAHRPRADASKLRERAEKAEAERDKWDAMHTRQAEQTARYKAAAEKAEAERDEARSRFNDKDLCLHGQAPCEDLLAAERTAYSAGWIAGRDAAANEIDCGCDHRKAAVAGTKHSRYGVCRQGECLARLAADIRALTPPEAKP